jgi:hypothetical protein
MKRALILIGLFAGSVILETGLAYVLRKDFTAANLETDELEYFDLSARLIEGRYEIEPRRTIGFVLILAGLRALGADDPLSMQFGVAFVVGLVSPLAYLLALRETGSRRGAILAGLGVMLWPPFAWFGATLYSETAALPVFAGFLLAVPAVRGSGAIRGWRWLGAGAVLGACMHIRPMYLLFSPFAAVIGYWRSPRGVRGLLSCLALAAGCAAVVLPWSVVASIQEKKFVLLSTIGGEVFAGGMNPELLRADRDPGEFFTTPANRSTWVGPGKWLPVHKTGFLNPAEGALPYSEKARMLTARALAWAWQNPDKALFLSMRKLTYMWGIYPLWSGRMETILGNIPAISLLVIALAAVGVYRRYLIELALLWTPAVFVTLLALVSWGSWRFRQPGDLGLIILAASLPFAAEVKRYLASMTDESRQREPISTESAGQILPVERPIEGLRRGGLALECG